MRTNIVIDDELMSQAMEMTSLKTKKDVVDHAMRLLIQFLHQERARELRGKVRWTGDDDPVPASTAAPTGKQNRPSDA